MKKQDCAHIFALSSRRSGPGFPLCELSSVFSFVRSRPTIFKGVSVRNSAEFLRTGFNSGLFRELPGEADLVR